MLKKISLLLAIIAVFLLGGYLTHRYYQSLSLQKEISAQTLLNRVESVAKLITVEGYFSEIYSHKDYYGYDISLFRKKALLRVKAKVSVGYDMNEFKIELDSTNKKLIISHLPDPEILSIDHDIDYYDIQDGVFNSFTNEDYTRMNADAKEFIRAKALESDLFEKADNQSVEMLEMIKFMVESAGWQLETRTRYETPNLN